MSWICSAERPLKAGVIVFCAVFLTRPDRPVIRKKALEPVRFAARAFGFDRAAKLGYGDQPFYDEAGPVVKPELGTKRIDPETGRKFYDLNKDPIVSPYTGKSYPRTYFESAAESAVEEEEIEAKEVDAEDEAPEVVSLEEADDEVKGEGDDLPDLGDDDDVDLGDDDDDDTFLADEEEEDDDVADIIGVGDDDDEI
jgi:uncharacterized protein (TIGR02300 family)